MGDPVFANGAWHKVEIYYKGSTGTTTEDGALKMWVDNIPLLDRTNVNLNPDAENVMITNIWDSINTALPQEEWVDYDHAYVSVPGATSTGSPPKAPTHLTVT
jgi:hypothetical protein